MLAVVVCECMPMLERYKCCNSVPARALLLGCCSCIYECVMVMKSVVMYLSSACVVYFMEDLRQVFRVHGSVLEIELKCIC